MSAPRWIEVLSHLHPRYGGLSSAVPSLAGSLNAGQGGVPLRVEVAAFCAPGEQFVPHGFVVGKNVRFWPASRVAWLRDRLRGNALRRGFMESLRGAEGMHLHGLWETSTAVSAAAARRLGMAYVLSAHGMLEPWALQQRRLRKQLYAALLERPNARAARAVHALTEAEARQFNTFGVRCPVAVIPNPVAVPAGVTEELFLAQFPELRGTRIVLFCGRLHPKKGLDLLLAAWSRLAPLHRDARLVLAGPDADGTRAGLEGVVAANGLRDSVVFPGMLAGGLKWSALAAAEAAVLPSRSEGLSMSVLEALGMGRPVVITDGCNMPEVRERGAGWVVGAEIEPLGAALAELLDNSRAANAAIGICGARLVAERYAPEVVSRQMAELYTWAAGGARPSTVDLRAAGTGAVRSFAAGTRAAERESC